MRVDLFANIVGLAVCLAVFAVLWFSYFVTQKRITVSLDVLIVPILFVVALAVGVLYVYVYLDAWIIAAKQ